jgi:hypothetical protein
MYWGSGDVALNPTVRLRRPTEGQIEFSQVAGSTVGIALRLVSNAGGNAYMDTFVAGDTLSRLRVQGDATRAGILFSSGSATHDIELGRGAAGILLMGTNGTSNAARFRVASESGQGASVDVMVEGDTAVRARLQGDTTPGLYFGPGGSGPTKVVGERITGYSALTGGGDRGTVWAVSTITTAQLAARVKAIQDDLTTHGMIGA